MRTTFLLAKFYDNPNHADDFESGLVYMNRLSYFKGVENECQDPTGRQDGNEGTTGWLQPGRGILNINGVLIQDAQIQIQKYWLDDLHVFCMHAMHTGDLDLDRLAATNDVERLRRQLKVPPECLVLGYHVVVIRDVPAFVRRVTRTAMAKNFRLKCGLVDYYDPETFHGQFKDEDSVFRKQDRYKFQREFRVAINTGTQGNDAEIMDIGDISDITLRLKSTELNGPKLIGGDLQFSIRPSA